MNPPNMLGLSAIATLGAAFLSGSTLAQQNSLKDQLVGTWTLVSNVNVMKDGSKLETFAANPKGTFIIEANGHFATVITRPDLPKVAANDRLKPTPEEAMAVARGSIAYFGDYTVDEASKSMMLRIEGTTFPNQLGVEQKRVITSISADEVKINNPSVLGEAVVRGESVWKRVK
jgi:hypothetical protein